MSGATAGPEGSPSPSQGSPEALLPKPPPQGHGPSVSREPLARAPCLPSPGPLGPHAPGSRLHICLWASCLLFSGAIPIA